MVAVHILLTGSKFHVLSYSFHKAPTTSCSFFVTIFVSVEFKYARILLFQFVLTKYVIGFRNYDGFIFVIFDVIFQNVIMRKYDKIWF